MVIHSGVRPFPLFCAASALLSVSPLAACSGAAGTPRAGDPAASSAEPIINGQASDSSQNAVVLVLNDVDLGGYECTGTLLAPNLVLTARHCVSQTSDGGFACDQNGNVSGTGGTVGADFTPGHIYVQTGVTRPANATAAQAHGTKIYHDGGTVLCNHDLALVLLDTKIAGAVIAPVRLDDTAVPDEQFTAVGWGVVSDQNLFPTTRQQRTGLKVIDVGPAVDTNLQVDVGPSEFVTGEDSCEGDSGGPAFDAKTGAVIGVVSRGGNGVQPNANGSNVAETCSGSGTANFYTQVSPFKSLLLQAYKDAGQDPWPEGGPNPTLARFGETCGSDADCQSSLCLSAAGVAQCTQTCDATHACPSAYDCKSTSAGQVCSPAPTNGASGSSGGCTASRARGSDAAAWLAIGAGVLAASWGRRRRRSS
jgi:hypothetical protein